MGDDRAVRGTFATAHCPDCRASDVQHAADLAAKDATIEALERRIDELHWRLGKAYLAAEEMREDAEILRKRREAQRETDQRRALARITARKQGADSQQ